jgi:hypothetical protein
MYVAPKGDPTRQSLQDKELRFQRNTGHCRTLIRICTHVQNGTLL